MNRRVCVCVGLIVWCGLTANAAFAQTPPTSPAEPVAGIPTDIKSMADATPFRSQIHTFVLSELDQLAGEDAAVTKAARDKLIAECTGGSTDSYFDVYSQEVNAAVVAMLSKNPPPRLRVRLNLAVLVEAIAEIAKTTQIEDAVIKLIDDPADVVALWGMKAARPVVAAVLAQPAPNASDKLIVEIMPSLKKHPKAGYAVGEAYRALIPDDPKSLSAAQLAVIFPTVMDILNYRISLYKTGVPDSPDAETAVTKLLSAVAQVGDDQQKLKIVQTLVDLISVAGEQAQTASKTDCIQIIKMVDYAVQVLRIISPGSESDLNPVMRMPSSLPGPQVYPRTKTVYDILKQVFPSLVAPPDVTPATAPATAN
jgi:hypothetical protein